MSPRSSRARPREVAPLRVSGEGLWEVWGLREESGGVLTPLSPCRVVPISRRRPKNLEVWMERERERSRDRYWGFGVGNWGWDWGQQ